eukprot:1639762-Rhodomonas_salina.1
MTITHRDTDTHGARYESGDPSRSERSSLAAVSDCLLILRCVVSGVMCISMCYVSAGHCP